MLRLNLMFGFYTYMKSIQAEYNYILVPRLVYDVIGQDTYYHHSIIIYRILGSTIKRMEERDNLERLQVPIITGCVLTKFSVVLL